MTSLPGYQRRKTREQAQEILHFSQDQFDGQNSDSPPERLGARQMALLRNVVAWPDRLEGGQGAVLYSLVSLPGSGDVWAYKQHPLTGKVLLARGDGLWLSTSAAMTGWDRLTGRDLVTTIDGPPDFGDPISNVRLRGLKIEDTDAVTFFHKLYLAINVVGDTAAISVYRDSDLTILIAAAEVDMVAGVFDGDALIAPAGGSAVSGVLRWNTSVAPASYDTEINVTFAEPFDDVMDSLDINIIKDDFFVFAKTGYYFSNTYIDQTLKQYSQVSLQVSNGYGSRPITPVDLGDVGPRLEYRYLYTFSRIVDPSTHAPAYTSSRITAALLLEGPGNNYSIPDGDLSDYSIRQQAIEPPIDEGDPVTVPLYRESGGAILPLGVGAPAYITHFSIYRTKNVYGVDDPSLTNGNDPNQYIWVKDVPIYETSFQDDVSDDVLEARSTASLLLDSRGWVEMLSGLGVIGPDFVNASDGGSRYDYQSTSRIQPTGSLIGYHDGRQRRITPVPVLAMRVMNTVYVTFGEYKTMISVAGVNAPGSNYENTPLIQDFRIADDVRGVRAVGSICFVDASDIAALCSDGTVRVFNASVWGAALDMGASGLVHKQVLTATTTAVLGYVRNTLLLFFTIGSTPHCLRYAASETAGLGWSEISRDTYPWPFASTSPASLRDSDGVQRLIVIDRESVLAYSVENPEDDRQWKDDVPESVWTADGTRAAHITSVVIGGATATLYGRYSSAGDTSWRLWLTSAARDAADPGDSVAFCDNLDFAGDLDIIEQNASGISGTLVSDGTTVGTDSDLDAVFSRIAVLTDFPTKWRPRALIARAQNNKSFHKESHVYYKPQPGETLPTGFLVGAQGLANNEAVVGADAQGIASAGDVQFFIGVGGDTIQLEYSTNKSGFIVTGMDTDYQTHDMRGENGPQNGPAASAQSELESGLTHYLEGQYVILNRANSLNYTLTGDAPTLVPDASGRKSWGLQFAGGNYSQVDARVYADLTAMLWIKGVPSNTAFFSLVGTHTLELKTGADTELVVNIDGTPTTYTTAITPSSWTHIAVSRSAGTLRVYVNGALLAAQSVSDAMGGTSVSLASSGSIFDFRASSRAMSAAAIKYYYDDVTLEGGKLVLPP